MIIGCRGWRWCLLAGWMAVQAPMAPASAAEGEDLEPLHASLARIIPGQQADSVVPTPLAGIYEVTYGSEVFYISADGAFVLQGDLYDIASQTNLTEERRAETRLRLMATIQPSEAIVFAPKKPHHVVYVFTDVDCTYCRRLHREIQEYLSRDIEIRYLAFPRSGPNTDSFRKAVSVWCATDPQRAITQAKAGAEVATRTCPDVPVQKHYELGLRLGITGTPTLVFQDGSVYPGYLPAAQLIRYLDDRFL